jgi:pimeloyl-ACP methyl ester carboxylesterase
MKKHSIFLIFYALLLLTALPLPAQDRFREEPIQLLIEGDTLFGTMTLPEKADSKSPVSLIIAGSGPTDRNGNNPMMTNNSLQMLAHALAERGIASLRYDKRGIAESKAAMVEESQLRFEDYIRDARAWTEKIREDYELGEISIIGHSEGSLIGMQVALQADVDKFVSLAGPAESADQILRQQLADQPDPIKAPSYQIIEQLAAGDTVGNVPMQLYALFRPSVQPYLISWFAYEPQNVIEQLKMPVLIVQGTTDIQVSVAQAQMLAKSAPQAQLLIVEGMNHILKNAPPQKTPNAMTYNQPELPVVAEAVEGIASFLHTP